MTIRATDGELIPIEVVAGSVDGTLEMTTLTLAKDDMLKTVGARRAVGVSPFRRSRVGPIRRLLETLIFSHILTVLSRGRSFCLTPLVK